jgi:NAD(P)-dependent dehydrogenase (short-subunit alcohol dehydrogenase family)
MQALAALRSMNRLGEAREVAHLVHLLVLDRASFLTAEYFTVAGGISRGTPFATTAAPAVEQAGAGR